MRRFVGKMKIMSNLKILNIFALAAGLAAAVWFALPSPSDAADKS
jgi:hypothetical protein